MMMKSLLVGSDMLNRSQKVITACQMPADDFYSAVEHRAITKAVLYIDLEVARHGGKGGVSCLEASMYDKCPSVSRTE